MRSVGAVIALESEARAILDNPEYLWKEAADGVLESSRFPLGLIISGVGKAYASWAYAVMSPRYEAVLSMGTSGGLSDEPVGSLYRVSEFAEHDMCVESLGCVPGVTPYGPLDDPIMRSSSPELDELLSRACREAGFDSLAGRAMAGDEFITNQARAASKRDYFGASVVDMETSAMAKLALSRSRRPFAALRMVSDNANHDSRLDWKANLALAAARFDAVLLALGRILAADRV